MYLLTALPRTGKSTAIKKIVSMLGQKNCGGFYTEEIRENGERVGFKIITLSGKTGILSHIDIQSEYKISRYGVNLTEFENLCLNELEYAINSNTAKYIIIDEIGPMQLFSEKYKQLLYSLLNSSKIIIGTIFYSEHEWLDKFKKEQNVNLIEITTQNRNSLPLEIVEIVSKNNPAFNRKVEKAKRYTATPEIFEKHQDCIIVHSEHATRTITNKDNRFVCTCDYYLENGTCSHIISAINLFGNN